MTANMLDVIYTWKGKDVLSVQWHLPPSDRGPICHTADMTT